MPRRLGLAPRHQRRVRLRRAASQLSREGADRTGGNGRSDGHDSGGSGGVLSSSVAVGRASAKPMASLPRPVVSERRSSLIAAPSRADDADGLSDILQDSTVADFLPVRQWLAGMAGLPVTAAVTSIRSAARAEATCRQSPVIAMRMAYSNAVALPWTCVSGR
ncbi:hypothetical protein BOS5A_211335 [Bosea sp. EC-HK365B]|nr:conserved hypothetical protein [Bosea sp. 21B]CAD5301232.1 conserved hypothetical protein [Bosea sp. 7B]VVT60544.1 hypothetical protein BOS5A_211335 [Bosea sp. EC-HK365B]VXB65719.1 conserved hypothetical protein [Bosea sp. 127]